MASSTDTEALTPQPIEHYCWMEPGKLLAGEYPRDLDDESSIAKINALLDAGVSAFIDLTEIADGLQPYTELLGTAPGCRTSRWEGRSCAPVGLQSRTG